MKKNLRLCSVSFVVIVFALTACQTATPTAEEIELTILPEHPVQQIELAGPVAAARAEVSGMAWCGESLILMPQYPDQYAEEGIGQVFSIPKSQISGYLSNELVSPIEPMQILFDTDNLPVELGGFEGFEAITFVGDRVYVTIEAREGTGMLGYLVSGSTNADCSEIKLNRETAVTLEPQANLSNMSDETIIYYQNDIYTIYEANGLNINPNPVAHCFDENLVPFGDVPMAQIEYRVTDATTADADGVFWAINYFYPGDTKLIPAEDQIAMDYGIGASHQSAEQVERLIAFQITTEGIKLSDLPPIYLELTSGESNNWEGLARMDNGFLLVTDEYPSTILGYVDDSELLELIGD
ncbi:MAG: hypothetical protein SVR81_06015 [Chloroflexota bacterium]|nr:hypothetical protein [Chloroflexota bacterium]